MRKRKSLSAAVLALLCALLLSLLSAAAFADDPAQAKADAVRARVHRWEEQGKDVPAEIRKLMEKGKLYEAALSLEESWADFPEACDAIWAELEAALETNRPETGRLERTIPYEGGNELRLNAESCDVAVTAADVSSGRYVRSYLRQGESDLVYLPGGEYTFTVEGGFYWFDGENGFGVYGEAVTLDENLVFEYLDAGSWVDFTRFEFTF